MSAAHTHGPWRVEDPPSDQDPRLCIMGHNGEWIAEVRPYGNARDSNAQLIASAPELLTALRWLVSAAIEALPKDQDINNGLSRAAAQARVLLARFERDPFCRYCAKPHSESVHVQHAEPYTPNTLRIGTCSYCNAEQRLVLPIPGDKWQCASCSHAIGLAALTKASVTP